MEQVTETYTDEQLSCRLRRCGHVLYHQSHHSQQDAVLALLRQGPLNQKQIQEQLSTRPGSVSELISKLESKQLVERRRDDDDRRRVVLSLTEKGQIAALIHKERPSEDLFAALTEEEKEQLAGLLGKLLESWGF